MIEGLKDWRSVGLVEWVVTVLLVLSILKVLKDCLCVLAVRIDRLTGWVITAEHYFWPGPLALPLEPFSLIHNRV